MDWSPKDVEQKLKSSRNPNYAIDFQFLLAQREVPQRGFMSTVDGNDIKRESRKRKRCSTPNNPERVSESSSLDEEFEIDELSSGEEYCDRSRTPRPASVTLELPAK